MNEPPKADISRLIAANEFLMNAFAAYAKENNFNALELFMAAHNFHKDMVWRVARLLELNEGHDQWKTFREADMTFRDAMRDLKGRAPRKVDISGKSYQSPEQSQTVQDKEEHQTLEEPASRL